MATQTYDITFTPTPGSIATLVEYRALNTTEWITPVAPANPTTLAHYPLELAENNTYYVAVSSIGKNCTRSRRIITIVVPSLLPCCPDGFTLAPDQTYCFKNETMPPEIISGDICLAFSKNEEAYSQYGAKMYNPGFGVNLPVSSSFVQLTTPYWTGTPAGYGNTSLPGSEPNESVMNRDAVWTDSDCNGIKDALARCASLQFTYLIELDEPKRVYVGLGGDNTFRLDLNNSTIVQCEAGPFGYSPPFPGESCATAPPANGETTTNVNFNIWHIVPVDLLAGPNYLLFAAIGDGSINDAFAAIVYDNTPEQIIAAQSDDDLNILFRTGDYKGSSIDIATCPPGWVLDTTGGSGNYVCRRITTSLPVPC